MCEQEYWKSSMETRQKTIHLSVATCSFGMIIPDQSHAVLSVCGKHPLCTMHYGFSNQNVVSHHLTTYLSTCLSVLYFLSRR